MMSETDKSELQALRQSMLSLWRFLTGDNVQEVPANKLPTGRAISTIKELRAIVGAFPHTADGVPVVPGMKLYPLHPIPACDEDPEFEDHGIATIGIYDPATMTHHVHGYDDFRTGVCYSSEEAARTARSKGPMVNLPGEGE